MLAEALASGLHALQIKPRAVMVVIKERKGKIRREFPQQYHYWAVGTGSKELSDRGGKVRNKVEILTEVLLY